ASVGVVDGEGGQRSVVAEVVAILVEALGGVALSASCGDRRTRRRQYEVVQGPGGDDEAGGPVRGAVGAGHGAGSGRLRGAARAAAGGVRVVDRERGVGGDVAEVVAEGVEALGGVGLAAAGRDRRGGGVEREVVEG